MTSLIVLFSLTYVISAIPFGVVVSRLKGVDLRQVGSGNIGATNVYRALGIKVAAFVFLLDAIKGFIPTFISMQLFSDAWVHVVVGCVSIVGHSLSCFVKFKGGKGAATGIGVLVALSPVISVGIILLAAAIIKWTRYVSLATILCSVVTPILFYSLKYPNEYVLFLIIICLFIILRHKSNIERLLKGQENKI